MCAILDKHAEVEAWVKNHKLFLEIPYLYFGSTWRYRPDFVVRFHSGLVVLVEGKGEASERDDAKATAARRWVEAVNTWGGLGTWLHHVCYDASSFASELDELAAAADIALR
jgi:type III restriction enzyme